jgi:chromosome segregation ATPase
MPEYTRIPCPNCGHALKVRREYLGRSVECKKCAHVFVLRETGEQPGAAETPGSAHAELLARWEMERASLAGEVERWRRMLDERETTLAEELSRRHLEADALKSQLDQASAERESLNDERHKLSLVLEDARAECESLRAEIANSRAEQKRLEDAHTQLEAEHDRINGEHLAEVDRLKAAHADQKGRADASEREIEELTRLLDGARGDAERARQERELEAQAAQTALETEKVSRAAEQQSWDATLKSAQAEHEKAVASLEEQRKEAEERFAESERRVGELTLAVSQAQDFKHQIRTFLNGLGIRLPS